MGEFLEAFAYAKEAADRLEPPPVLIIDEVEKLELKIQNLLLQPLARGWANVPKLEGVIGVRRREQMPIVILTTNNLKMLSEPLALPLLCHLDGVGEAGRRSANSSGACTSGIKIPRQCDCQNYAAHQVGHATS